MHGLVRCKHECRCSRTRGADVSFRDVTIKIPDRGCDQGCEWRQAQEAWAEIWEKSVSWDWDLGEVRRICALRAPHVLAEGVADGKDSIERWYLSPYVEKPFNSKVIKSFVPELRSRKCFSCFGIPMLSLCALWTLWTFCVPVWIYLFHIFMYGYVTVLPNPQCWLFFFLLGHIISKSSLECQALYRVISFLVPLSTCLSFSLVHFYERYKISFF